MRAMRFRLFGTEIYVSFLFAATIAALLAIDRTGLLLPSLTAILLHETGHLFAMWTVGCAPRQIRLIPASVQIVSGLPERKNGELIVAVSGPAVNLILFISLYINYLSFHGEWMLTYALIQLLTGLFNLLPVRGLDGGTVLFLLLCRKAGERRASLWTGVLTLTVAAAALFGGVLMLLRGQLNLSLFTVGLYLLIAELMKM